MPALFTGSKGQSLRSMFPRNQNANFGVQKEPLATINVNGGLAVATMDSDRRFHQIDFQCTALNYTGGAALPAPKISSTSGAGLTITPTVVNGVVTALFIVSGGTGWVAADTFTLTDATGAGFVGSVTTVSGGAVTSVAIVSTGTPTAVNPLLIISNIQMNVGTTAVCEVTAAHEMFRAQFNKIPVSYGTLPIYFTEPWRKHTNARQTSWDMAGQGTFNIKFNLIPGYTQIGIAGTQIFDFIRNTYAGEIDQVTYQAYINSGSYPAPRVDIISRKLLTFPIAASATGAVIPAQYIPTGWPILRMHFFPATPGTVNGILMKADTNTIEQGTIGATNGGATLDQLKEWLFEYGFQTNLTNTAPNIAPDYSFISDYDNWLQNRLKVQNLSLQIASTAAQNMTVLQEVLQGSYT